jgi:hypothetical protein
LEASRLARNDRDWHPLLEFCGLVGTLTDLIQRMAGIRWRM